MKTISSSLELIRLTGELYAVRILLENIANKYIENQAESDDYGAALAVLRCAEKTLKKLSK